MLRATVALLFSRSSKPAPQTGDLFVQCAARSYVGLVCNPLSSRLFFGCGNQLVQLGHHTFAPAFIKVALFWGDSSVDHSGVTVALLYETLPPVFCGFERGSVFVQMALKSVKSKPVGE